MSVYELNTLSGVHFAPNKLLCKLIVNQVISENEIHVCFQINWALLTRSPKRNLLSLLRNLSVKFVGTISVTVKNAPSHINFQKTTSVQIHWNKEKRVSAMGLNVFHLFLVKPLGLVHELMEPFLWQK